MAEEKMEKQPAPTTTPDAVPPSPPVEKKKLQPRAAPPPFPPVPDVILWWVLCNAGSVCFSFVFSPAYVFIANTICNNPPSCSCLLLPHVVELTDWELAVVRALLVGSLWCSTPQAAAGVLALALPCHRRRARVLLTYAALAPTVASHCMLARVLCVFVAADPGGMFFWIFGTASILMFAVADLLCFLVLLRLRARGEEEQYCILLQLGAPRTVRNHHQLITS